MLDVSFPLMFWRMAVQIQRSRSQTGHISVAMGRELVREKSPTMVAATWEDATDHGETYRASAYYNCDKRLIVVRRPLISVASTGLRRKTH
jgi:hypothetical protein